MRQNEGGRRGWMWLVGRAVACGWLAAWLAAAAADSDGSFTLSAPSASRQRLLVVRAWPGSDGVALEMIRTEPLGFPGGTIAAHATDVGPPAGSGPRHLVYHPRLPLVYFSEEQGLGVSIYRRAHDGRLSLWQRSRAVPADAPGSGVTSSDIVITPDGKQLYAGIRGHDHPSDFIACYRVGEDGSLVPRGLAPADKIAWGMALSPDGRFLAVTGFGSATLMLCAVAAEGDLTRVATLSWDERIADLVAR
jgi:hypothetical protein